jgi:hypothetical protein
METNKELTSIEVAVLLSKQIIQLKNLLLRVREVKIMAHSISGLIFHELEPISTFIHNIEYTIDKKELDIRSCLDPYLKGYDYVYPGKYSFAADELVDGFATIERVLQKNSLGVPIKTMQCALLLSDYIDETKTIKFGGGSILSFDGNKDTVLKNAHSVITLKELQSFAKPSYLKKQDFLKLIKS